MPASQASAGGVSATTLLLLVVFALCLGMLLLSPSAPPRELSGPAMLQPKQEPALKHAAIDDLQSGEEGRGFVAKPGFKGVLLLHAPWCGHCKVMMPAYEAAATTLKAEGFGVARLQAEQAGAPFLASLDVRGFPTILGVRDGTTVPYSGARTEAALLEFVRAL